MENNKILREEILTQNKPIQNFLNITLLFGSLGFLIAGISSYLNKDLLPLIDSEKILFFPQGLTMSFYGLAGTILSINQIILLYLKIGEGYNEFNKEKGEIIVFRKKSYNEKDNIELTYKITDIVRNKSI